MEICNKDLFLYRMCPNLLNTKAYSMIPLSFWLRELFFDKLSEASSEREFLETILTDKLLLSTFKQEDLANKIKRSDNEMYLKNLVATFFTMRNEIMSLNKRSNRISYVHKNVEQTIVLNGTDLIYKYTIPYFILQANVPDIIPIFSIDSNDIMSYYEPISYYNSLHLSDTFYKVMTLKIILVDPCNKFIAIETLRNFVNTFQNKLYINQMNEALLTNYYKEIKYLSSDHVLCNRCTIQCVKNLKF